MKKLLTILVSATLAVFAARASVSLPVGTSFEALETGSAIDFYADDEGVRGTTHWYAIPSYSSLTKVCEYAAGEALANRPDQFGDTPNAKYLTINGFDKVYRSIDFNNGAKPFTPYDISEGLYCDMQIKFTPAISVQKTEPEDKLVLWLRIEDTGVATVTNLIIVAGFLTANNVAQEHEYVVTSLDGASIGAGFDYKGWHRLTVKSIREISGDLAHEAVGFVVFIDGKVAGSSEAKGEAGSYLDELNPIAAKWAQKNALFPSLWSPRDIGGQELTSVCFVGKGSVDDISVTDVSPAFAKDRKVLDVRADGKVDTVKYCADGSGVFRTLSLTGGVGSIDLGTEAVYDVRFEVTYASGYQRGGWIFDGLPVEDGESVFSVGGFSTLEINSRAATPVCEVDGIEYYSLDEAFDSVPFGGSATITLLRDVSDEAYGAVAMRADVVLDLNGKKLRGGDFKYVIGGVSYLSETVIDNFGHLTVIDGSAEKTGRLQVTQSAYPCIWNAGDSTLTVAAGVYDGKIVDGVDLEAGETNAVIRLEGGSFASADSSRFYLEACVAKGCSAAYAGGYWVVSGVAEDDPVEPEDPVDRPVPASVRWDVRSSGGGGINAFGGANGQPYVQFTSLEVTEREVRVRILAKAICAEGERFAVVFRTGFGGTAEVIRRTGRVEEIAPSASGVSTEAVVVVERDEELRGYPQLFAVGIAPLSDGE